MIISEIKTNAKKFAFNNKWNVWKFVLVIGLLTGLVNYVLGFFGDTMVCLPNNLLSCKVTEYGEIVSLIDSFLTVFFGVSGAYYYLNLLRNKAVGICDALKFALNHFGLILVTTILFVLNVTIGSMLLIVPGLIASFGLVFFTYVICDNPTLTAKEVLKKAWDITYGYKWNYLGFILSFFGWFIICGFIIPIIWFVPFWAIANAMFYIKLCEINNIK